MTGVYLYAILDGTPRLNIGYIGLPDGRRLVTTLAGDGISAVVGKYDACPFADLTKPELLRCLATHQRVIERVIGDHRVLPAKFGTILDCHDELQALLSRSRAGLRAAFGWLGDAVEIEVVATWDLRRVLAEISREPSIAGLAASAAGQPPEQFRATQVQVGQMVKQSIDRRRDICRRQVLSELEAGAIETQQNALASDEMVLNVAFLIARGALSSFYDAVHRLDANFEELLTFRCIGPLPPYSFASVELVRPVPEDIEAASRLLQLGDQASGREVNAAYRRIAAHAHPDRNPDEPAAVLRFAALAQAVAQLKTYIAGQRACDGDDREDVRVPLTGAAVKASPMLAVRRSLAQYTELRERSDEREPVAV